MFMVAAFLWALRECAFSSLYASSKLTKKTISQTNVRRTYVTDNDAVMRRGSMWLTAAMHSFE